MLPLTALQLRFNHEFNNGSQSETSAACDRSVAGVTRTDSHICPPEACMVRREEAVSSLTALHFYLGLSTSTERSRPEELAL